MQHERGEWSSVYWLATLQLKYATAQSTERNNGHRLGFDFWYVLGIQIKAEYSNITICKLLADKKNCTVFKYNPKK